jgi:hypothetical protein
MVKLVEECAGTGELLLKNLVLQQVRYQIKVFQGMFEGNGLPNPTQRTIEGRIDLDNAQESGDLDSLVGADLTLRLDDGRKIGVTIADGSGAIHQRRHGGGACGCC